MSNPHPDQSGLRAAVAAKHEAALERRALAVAMYRSGADLKEIALEVGMKRDTVRAGLVKAGVIAPGRSYDPMTADEIDRARRLLEDGESYWSVGMTLCRGSQTIERNVPGFPKVSAYERGERSAVARRIRKL